MRTTVAWLSLSVVALLSVSARADVVGPPPTSCPEGSAGTSSHGGSYCEPSTCPTGGAACTSGRTCQTRSLCVEERKGYSRGGEFTFLAVTGSCTTGGTCAKGTCRAMSVCASDSLLATRGCSIGARGTGDGWAAILLLGILALRRRRA